MFLTASDRLADRAEAQAEDARERLSTIADARAEALSKITAALDEFIETVDRERVDNKDISENERRTAIEMLDEQLGEIDCDAVRSLERMELCEDEFDLRGDDDAADRWADQRRDDLMERR